MRITALFALLAAGCGNFYQHRTTRSLALDVGETWRHEVDYELLNQVTGQACSSEFTDAATKGGSRDPALNGPPALFEQAKYVALSNAKEADGLVAVRSTVASTNSVVCVTVIGRAYRIARLKATPSSTRPASTDLLQMKE